MAEMVSELENAMETQSAKMSPSQIWQISKRVKTITQLISIGRNLGKEQENLKEVNATLTRESEFNRRKLASISEIGLEHF